MLRHDDSNETVRSIGTARHRRDARETWEKSIGAGVAWLPCDLLEVQAAYVGINVRRTIDFTSFYAVPKYAVPRSHNGLFERAISETDSGCEILLLWIRRRGPPAEPIESISIRSNSIGRKALVCYA